jgi:hypothetical protein
VPGHTMHAECYCGFQRELAPGFDARGFIGRSIAYTESGEELNTFDEAEITKRNLITIPDPFLEGPESDSWSLAQWDSFFVRHREPQGPHRCPRCGQTSLMLHFRGNWD